jgi:diacylglycerol kinase family enzyme
VLGLFPGGATCDFAHTFGLDLKPPVAASVLASPRVIDVDVGVATCAGDGGGEVRRLVANAAVVGLGAVVQRRLDGGRGGRALSAWWSTLASYRRRHTDVDMVFAEWHDPCTQVWLANGQYGWGGLLVAPSALPEDGAWDVQVWGGARSLPFTLQPKMIRGEHLPHDDVATWRQKRVTVTSEPPSLVAADGAVVGTTPATFEIRSRALRLKT